MAKSFIETAQQLAEKKIAVIDLEGNLYNMRMEFAALKREMLMMLEVDSDKVFGDEHVFDKVDDEQIIRYIKLIGGQCSPRDIYGSYNYGQASVANHLVKLVKAGRLVKIKSGIYALPQEASAS